MCSKLNIYIKYSNNYQEGKNIGDREALEEKVDISDS